MGWRFCLPGAARPRTGLGRLLGRTPRSTKRVLVHRPLVAPCCNLARAFLALQALDLTVFAPGLVQYARGPPYRTCRGQGRVVAAMGGFSAACRALQASGERRLVVCVTRCLRPRK